MIYCSVEGCGEFHYGKGYCVRHYQQFKRTGRINLIEKQEKHTGCKVPGCTKEHFAKGYCVNHYYQIRTHGKITNFVPFKTKDKRCSVEGCNRKHQAKGLCSMHYKIEWRKQRRKEKDDLL